MTTIRASLVLLVAAALAGCPEKSADKTPSQALVDTVNAAMKADVEGFKSGISKNFQLTIERYQELSAAKPELKGAFEYPIFMNNLAMSAPVPKEELVKGDKATVKVLHKDGRLVQTEMVREDGAWKLDVPAGLVKNLDHFDEVKAKILGEQVAPTPDIKLGGGGPGDRMKKLPPNPTEAMIAKAQALDAFDLGDVEGARKMLAEALAKNPDDAELTVALGRAHVQGGDVNEAVRLLEGMLQKDPSAVQAMHYLGMAYMFQKKPKDAAAMWRKVGTVDPTYSKSFKLDERAAVAEQMGESTHGGGTAAPEGAASQPASPH